MNLLYDGAHSAKELFSSREDASMAKDAEWQKTTESHHQFSDGVLLLRSALTVTILRGPSAPARVFPWGWHQATFVVRTGSTATKVLKSVAIRNRHATAVDTVTKTGSVSLPLSSLTETASAVSWLKTRGSALSNLDFWVP